jgi:hypothetical protein
MTNSIAATVCSRLCCMRKVLSLQPECVRFDVYRTAAVLEQNQGSQRANAF